MTLDEFLCFRVRQITEPDTVAMLDALIDALQYAKLHASQENVLDGQEELVV